MSSKRSSQRSNAKKDDLLSKEEEYKRLNSELEKKTANIVYEADQVLKENERLLKDTSYLERIIDQPNERPLRIASQQPTKFKVDDDLIRLKQNLLRELDNNDSELGNDDDELNRRIEEMNIVPKVANEMSNEAQIRFLKAKLKVMQEEIERCGSEISKRDEENVKLAQRCKELEEDRVKQLRISNSHQTQMEKHKKLNDEMTQKLTQVEIQSSGMKKENESLKKDLKKSQLDHSQLELKLNRSLEEIEKLKLELNKQLVSKKDMGDQEKSKVEHLSSENKRLQKQKQELIQAFRKQMKLIDVLKRQKMHLEAAKVLQFAEQEFLNALEWNESPVGVNHHHQPGAPASSKGSAGSSRPPSGAKVTHKNNNNSNATHQLKQRSNSDRQLSSRTGDRLDNLNNVEFIENGIDDNDENNYDNDIIEDGLNEASDLKRA